MESKMDIKISGQHCDITDAISAHIKKKFEKLQKHFESLVSIHVFIKVEKDQHIAEATVHISHQDIFANAHSQDMYKTINMLTEKLDRQIVKHKEKIQVHHTH